MTQGQLTVTLGQFTKTWEKELEKSKGLGDPPIRPDRRAPPRNQCAKLQAIRRGRPLWPRKLLHPPQGVLVPGVSPGRSGWSLKDGRVWPTPPSSPPTPEQLGLERNGQVTEILPPMHPRSKRTLPAKQHIAARPLGYNLASRFPGFQVQEGPLCLRGRRKTV